MRVRVLACFLMVCCVGVAEARIVAPDFSALTGTDWASIAGILTGGIAGGWIAVKVALAGVRCVLGAIRGGGL